MTYKFFCVLLTAHLTMRYNLETMTDTPKKADLKRWIKQLEQQQKETEKRLELYRGLLAMEKDRDGDERKEVKKRKRAKSPDTIKMENEVRSLFAQANGQPLKIVNLLTSLKPQYPELKEEAVRSKIVHLVRSSFITPVEGRYGYYELANSTQEDKTSE